MHTALVFVYLFVFRKALQDVVDSFYCQLDITSSQRERGTSIEELPQSHWPKAMPVRNCLH